MEGTSNILCGSWRKLLGRHSLQRWYARHKSLAQRFLLMTILDWNVSFNDVYHISEGSNLKVSWRLCVFARDFFHDTALSFQRAVMGPSVLASSHLHHVQTVIDHADGSRDPARIRSERESSCTRPKFPVEERSRRDTFA